MTYTALLSSKAEDQLRNLPILLQESVIEHLEILCTSPTAVSRPTYTPPFPPNRQMYEFYLIESGMKHRFVVVFQYGQDEEHLWILGIGHMEYRL